MNAPNLIYNGIIIGTAILMIPILGSWIVNKYYNYV